MALLLEFLGASAPRVSQSECRNPARHTLFLLSKFRINAPSNDMGDTTEPLKVNEIKGLSHGAGVT
jgi:hypothetical protein